MIHFHTTNLCCRMIRNGSLCMFSCASRKTSWTLSCILPRMLSFVLYGFGGVFMYSPQGCLVSPWNSEYTFPFFLSRCVFVSHSQTSLRHVCCVSTVPFPSSSLSVRPFLLSSRSLCICSRQASFLSWTTPMVHLAEWLPVTLSASRLNVWSRVLEMVFRLPWSRSRTFSFCSSYTLNWHTP